MNDSSGRSPTAAAAGDRFWLGGLTLLLLALMVGSLGFGPFPVRWSELVGLMLDGPSRQAATPIATVVWQIRLPRILGAVLAGATLAAAGAAYQGMFRNPLVSPDILGVSTGAGLGAVLGIFLALPVAGIQALAFAGGLLTVALVYTLAVMVRGHDPLLVLVLAGVVVGTLASSAISLLKILADPYNQLPAITFWLLGSLAALNLTDLKNLLPAVAVGLLPLYLLRWRMNLLSLDDEEARALGVPTGKLRVVFITAATLMTAAVVSVSGVIGWIGLIMPHIARLLVGPNFVRLLPVSMLLGANFLLLVDNLARSLSTLEIPLGIVTALLGAPFFLWLLAHGQRSWR